jgi:hypothetical protein
MPERRLHLTKTPTTRDAVALYGFLCPILKMLPYDVYLRVEIDHTGLILETEKHYFDDLYNLSPKVGPSSFAPSGSDYLASLTGSRSYPIDAGSIYRDRRQLEEAGFLRKRAVKAFMSRYSKSSILKNAFDSDIKWEQGGDGDTLLVLTSSSEGDFKRLEKRILQQLDVAVAEA